MVAIDKLTTLAAGWRGTFAIGVFDDDERVLEFSSYDYDDDLASFQCADDAAKPLVDLLNAVAPALVEVDALRAEVTKAKAALAEAKRLGLEAIELAVGAMDNAPGHTGEPGDESAMAAGHRCADDIRTALEAL